MSDRVAIGENVTISKKLYDSLVRDSEFLGALRSAGVDNWDGYGYACEEFYGDGEDCIDPEDE